MADEEIEKTGLSGSLHIVKNRLEGLIDTGKMISSLFNLAAERGIHFLGGWEISHFEKKNSQIELSTSNGRKLFTNVLMICTNGYAHRWFPDEVKPARAQVLITSEIPGLKLNGGYHFNKGYYYFRNVGNRVLFGGGRNLDFSGEETDIEETTVQIQSHLDEILHTFILPGKNAQIEMRWAGVMGIGEKKSPFLQKTEDGIFVAIRMGGMGVALGTLIGQELAALVISDA